MSDTTVHFDLHGRSWDDPWEGLRREPGLLRAELFQESRVTENAFQGLRGAIDALRRRHEPQQLLAEEVPPAQRLGGYWYLSVPSPTSGSLRIVRVSCAAPRPTADSIAAGAAHEVALDPERLAPGHTVGAVCFSHDGRLAVWSADARGAERFEVHVTGVADQQDKVVPVPGCSPSVAVSTDGRHVFFVELDPIARPWRLWHLDTATSDRRIVLEEPDQSRRLRMHTSSDCGTLVVSSAARDRSTHWLISMKTGLAPTQPLTGLSEYAQVVVDVGTLNGRQTVFALVNSLELPAGRLLHRPIHNDGQWQVLLDGGTDCQVAAPMLLRDHVVLGCKTSDGSTRIMAAATRGTPVWRTVDAPRGISLNVVQRPQWEESTVEVAVVTYTRPPLVGALDLRSETPRIELPRAEPCPYVTLPIETTSPDGTAVPVTLLSRPDRIDGPAPCIMTAYGAYGVSQRPSFNPLLLDLLDAGLVYAVVHVRGGGEGGPAWHAAATGLNKHLTFDDFLSAAQQLVDRGIAAPDKLAMHGGSAGGLLIGAVLNMRPELFAAAAASVPFVDPLTTMLHPELPLTVSDRSEWGDPVSDPATLRCMLGYSPVHNVTATTYPPVLATVGLRDIRVCPLEALKWVRALRSTANGGPFLLRVRNGGHLGGADIDETVEAAIYEYAWLATKVGLRLPGLCQDQVPNVRTL